MPPPKAIDSLERLGIKTPGDYQIDCPFCESDKPKCGLSVRWRPNTPQRADWLSGTFHCFRCEGAGSVRRGYLYPARGMEANVHEFGKSRVETLVTPEDAPLECVKTLHAAWRIYRSLYPSSPAEAYLTSRGLDGAHIPAGWAPPGQPTLLNAGLNRDVLVSLRLIDSRGRDTLASGGGRVILPFSWKGKIVTLYGRAVAPNSLMSHLYTRAKMTSGDGEVVAQWRRGAFGDRGLDIDPVIVTEAPLDALALRAMGAPNVVALGGTANEVATNRIPGDARVGIAFDNDTDREQRIRLVNGSTRVITRNPGNDAARRLAEHLGVERTYRIVPPPLPNGTRVKDWADFLRQSKEQGVTPTLPSDVQAFLNGELAVESDIGLSA